MKNVESSQISERHIIRITSLNYLITTCLLCNTLTSISPLPYPVYQAATPRLCQMLIVPHPPTSTSHDISQQSAVSWKAIIVAAPVSDISPELVGSSEIYGSSSCGVQLTPAASRGRAVNTSGEAVFLSVLVMILGWMSTITRCRKIGTLERTIHLAVRMFFFFFVSLHEWAFASHYVV